MTDVAMTDAAKTEVAAPGSAEAAKDVVRRFYAAFGSDDRAALLELLSPDLHAYHQGGSAAQDLAGHLATIAGWNAAFSGTRFEIEEQIAEGGLVASRMTMHAIHDRAPFQGREPDGTVVRVPAVTLERVRDGRIVERRVMSDSLGMLQQLGAVPRVE